MRGRCPECGMRIEALRPRVQPAVPASRDDESGLVPLDEEWPEPAQYMEDSGTAQYGMAATPANWSTEPASPVPPRPEGYDLVGGNSFTPAPLAPGDPPDAGMAPVTSPITYQLSKAELEPLREPPPPSFTFFSGIYLFPWYPDNLAGWFYLVVDLTVMNLLGCVIHLLAQMLHASEFVAAFALPLSIPLVLILGLWSGAYAAVYFLAIVDDTAAGNNRVPRPQWTVFEGIAKLGYVVWILAWSFLPFAAGGLLKVSLESSLGLALLAVVLFPTLLLSSLGANAAWILFNPDILGRLFFKPRGMLALGLPPALMLIPSLWLANETIVKFNWALVPVAGFFWASCLMIYARLVGRIAWYITLGNKKKIRVKKRKPAVEVRGGWDDGNEAEPE